MFTYTIGNITIRGIIITQYFPTYFIYYSNYATIYLETDNFVFRINGGLSLQAIILNGIDMHVKGLIPSPTCAMMPNPIDCTCSVNNKNSQLYNKTSICYIGKTYVPNYGDSFLGFIELSIKK